MVEGWITKDNLTFERETGLVGCLSNGKRAVVAVSQRKKVEKLNEPLANKFTNLGLVLDHVAYVEKRLQELADARPEKDKIYCLNEIEYDGTIRFDEYKIVRYLN